MQALDVRSTTLPFVAPTARASPAPTPPSAITSRQAAARQAVPMSDPRVTLPSMDDYPTCDHGERTDRRTKNDRPICALCRRDEDRKQRRAPRKPSTRELLDAASLAAHDTLDLDEGTDRGPRHPDR